MKTIKHSNIYAKIIFLGTAASIGQAYQLDLLNLFYKNSNNNFEEKIDVYVCVVCMNTILFARLRVQKVFDYYLW